MEPRPGHFDEMFGDGTSTRAPYAAYSSWFDDEDPNHLLTKAREAEALMVPGAAPLSFTGRKMGGMVEMHDTAMADDQAREEILLRRRREREQLAEQASALGFDPLAVDRGKLLEAGVDGAEL